MITPKYTNTGGQPIANYNYQDIADGTGVQTFYLAASSFSKIFKLVGNTVIYSDTPVTVSDPGGTANVLSASASFATTFNLPKNLRGTVICNIGHGINTTGATVESYPYVTLKKISNGIATTLGAASGAVVTRGSTGVISAVAMIPFEVPLTHFKKGDQLVLKVDHYGNRSNSNLVGIYLGHDPQARDLDGVFASTSTSASRVHVPFVINI